MADLPQMGRWWETHPAYNDLVDVLKKHTWQAPHLAFLIITNLHAKGQDVAIVPRPAPCDHCSHWPEQDCHWCQRPAQIK